MEEKNANLANLEGELTRLIEKVIHENQAIIGVNIGTHGGIVIAKIFKNELKLNESEISSATSSLLFLSSKMLNGALNQDVSYNLIAGKETYLVSLLTKNITVIFFLNRELAELEGIDQHINNLKKFSLQISAFIETSDLIKEEIFVAIKRAIPNALILAILTKEGLPIKVQATMPEPMLSAMTSALYSLSEVLLESGLEFSIIAGDNGSIILHELDENRILCVAVPEAEERKIGAYIAKIKMIIKNAMEI